MRRAFLTNLAKKTVSIHVLAALAGQGKSAPPPTRPNARRSRAGMSLLSAPRRPEKNWRCNFTLLGKSKLYVLLDAWTLRVGNGFAC